MNLRYIPLGPLSYDMFDCMNDVIYKLQVTYICTIEN